MSLAYKKAENLKNGEMPWVDRILDRQGENAHSELRFGAEGYAGARRLMIELENEPKARRERYIGNYLCLVESVAGILKEEGVSGFDSKTGKNTYKELEVGGKMQLQEGFITGVWGVMYSNFDIKYGKNKSGLFYESLDSGIWACDNSSTLVFDVGRELGIPVQLIILHDHTLIRTDYFIFETTQDRNPGYCSVTWLKYYYPDIYATTSELGVIDSIVHDNRGYVHYKNREYGKAVQDLSRAVELDPEDLDAQKYLRLAKKKMLETGVK